MLEGTTIKGRVRAVIYQSRDNPFRIIGIDTAEGRRTVKGKEALHDLKVGEEAIFRGREVRDQRYGDQIEVFDVRKVMPDSREGLIHWLTNVGAQGMDQRTATRLVDAYGPRTVDAVVDGAEQARSILGHDADRVAAQLLPHRAEDRFGRLLAANDIDSTLRRRLYERYGLATEEIVRNDPYRIVVDVEGMSFQKADAIARSSRASASAESRTRAAIVETLRHAEGEGHTALLFGQIADRVLNMAQIPSRTTIRMLDTFEADGVETVDLGGRPALALSHLAGIERVIAERVLDKLDEEPGVTMPMAREAVAAAERELKVELNREQRLAAVQALVCPISIMTGGPGTGKTTTLRAIVAAWNILISTNPDLGRRRTTTLGSPTGKAAKRMTEVTGILAQTFHRMLEIDTAEGGFRRNEANPIEAGLLAFDEVSMADVPIFGAASLAWGTSNVLLIGDPDQLESVGAGRVFGDLISSGEVPTVHLVEVRRQAKGSAIALGASLVRQGRPPVTTPVGQSDLCFVEQGDPAAIAAHVARLAGSIEGDVQVLCPGHGHEVGTVEMNRRLQMVAGNQGPHVRISRGALARRGDKVIQTDNDYDCDVFNGDTGTVSEVTSDGRSAVVVIGKDQRSYASDKLSQLELAFALTVHKSQGSEYDTVIIPLHECHYGLLKRTILYTAMTRAKKQCIIVGSRRAFARALANDESSKRQTTLCEVLKAMAG